MSGFRYTPGRARPDLTAAAEAGVRAGVEHVLGVARSRAPIEEATLERSGKATTESGPGRVSGAVSFDTPYAARQHEELGWRHDTGRQAKYLESAHTGEATVVRDLIAEQLRRALR